MPGYRIYRTGDMGRLLLNGMIEFLGRRDFQTKIRGHRVECEEIEIALGEHPEIAHAAVTVHQNARGEQELIAYVVPRQECSVSWRDFLREVLPNYMIPQAIFVLQSMPRTASGKIDRKALPLPEDVLSHRTGLCRTGQSNRKDIGRNLDPTPQDREGRSPRRFFRVRRTFSACDASRVADPSRVRGGDSIAPYI